RVSSRSMRKTGPDFAARRLGYIGRVVREKSSNPVDVCAESAAKHGAAVSAPRAIQKANCRRPLKRKDLQVDSAFRFRWSFQHDLSLIPASAFPDHTLAERRNAAFTINEEQSALWRS